MVHKKKPANITKIQPGDYVKFIWKDGLSTTKFFVHKVDRKALSVCIGVGNTTVWTNSPLCIVQEAY